MIEGRTLWELLEKRVEATPDARMTLDEEGRELTFAEYKAASEQAAAGLASLGIGEGDVVSWQLPTWNESLVLIAALARLGAVQNPILPIYREREVGFVVRQAKTKLLVTPQEFNRHDFATMAQGIAAGVNEEGGNLQTLVVEKGAPFPPGDVADLPAPPTPSDDLPVRWLFYTSGTTADPKGAQHTDGTVSVTAKNMGQRYRVTEDDKVAMVFPVTHIGGVTWLLTALQYGCELLMLQAFNPTTTVPFLAENDVTLAGAGTAFHQVYLGAQREAGDAPIFPKVRAFPGGGAPKPPQLHYDLKVEMGGVGILSGYGLTEAPILVLADAEDTDEVLAETEGGPMPGVELKLVTTEGKVAGPGEEGEVRAKAPQMMKGYLDSSLDEAGFDEDGWFRTGDLGKQDADGNLVITGRLKDIIIRNGENISAKEVEDLLYQHPKVADVAVIGIPNEKTGERAVAVIQPAEGDAITQQEMREFLTGEGLMVQKVPEQLELIEVLPRNPTGKILKHELRATYGA
jgi:acyl-CoA synthetase (AMP-forming)/AMP-acid ligase II